MFNTLFHNHRKHDNINETRQQMSSNNDFVSKKFRIEIQIFQQQQQKQQQQKKTFVEKKNFQ